MGFPRRLLNDDEDLVLDLRPHWWFFAGPFATVAASLLLAVVVRNVSQLLLVPVVGVLLAAVGWLVGRYARWATTSFVLTSNRLIFRSGVLSKRSVEIPLERVHNVIASQNLAERVLGVGDLLIESAGASGQQHFTDIPKPAIVQNEIYGEIEARARRPSGLRGGDGAGSVADRLEQLHRLHRAGVITDSEYETKKRGLLDQL